MVMLEMFSVKVVRKWEASEKSKVTDPAALVSVRIVTSLAA
jgi:hypothetical protein